MTNIALRQDGSLRKLVCNGRTIAYDGRITKVEHVSAGRWEGVAGNEAFEIIGGRASGGASNEWFVKWEPGFGSAYIPVKSAAEALRAIESC